MDTASLFYIALILLVTLWLRWRRKQIRVFQDLGIPGPNPNILFGNILELNKKGFIQCHKEWFEKYGSIVGFYHGMRPILLVTDPDLLKKIFIKDFNLFCDRPESVPMRVHTFLDPIIPANDIMDTVLTNLKGEKWKEVRRILTPTFSAAKLKRMIPAVNEVTDITLSILRETAAEKREINMLEIFQRLTLDIICAQAFAMNIDSQHNPDSPLLRSAKIIFDLPFDSKIVFFGRCFPGLEFFSMAVNFLQMFIRNKGYIPPLKITQVLKEVIKERRNNPDMRRPDLLQMLIDASSSPNEKTVHSTEGGEGIPHKKFNLTDLEIQANALVVFLAGYETTSSGLAYAFYYLSKYPYIQRKLQEEIDEVFKSEVCWESQYFSKNPAELDYTNVGSLQNVENFILESMRMSPPAINFVKRTAIADVDYGYVFIPKGMEINIPVHYIHHSEVFFEKPEEFNPDRFLPENLTQHKSVNYWTYGVGPRKCIGTRLVSMTTKIVMAKILREFDVFSVDDADELTSDLKINTMVPTQVLVRLQRRL